MEARRRIRISFSDPDATDSDSGDDASSASCGKTTKIVILHCSSSTSARKSPGAGGCCSQQKQAIRSSSASCWERAVVGSAPMKRCRGVYERQPGRWAAEFRSHRLKARHWIGTFATEEEATAAYDDFEKQFVPSRRCGLPLPLPLTALQRGGRSAGVHRASHPHRRQRQRHPPDTEKRQIVQALTATGVMLPPLPSAPSSAPCVSSSTSALPQPPLMPAPPTLFSNAQPHADALPSVHAFWADEPADEDLVGLADLGHLPLPFSDGSMDFDPADLSLFDGFL